MLAWNLLCENCANLIEFLGKIISSDKFLSLCKKSCKDFIRNRILPFHHIIFFLVNLIKGSYQDELDYFFKAGETEISITSLIDTETYPAEIFYDLYHHRWPVEEDYKVMKCRIEIENFTGKSVLSVYQDFHARVFSKNLTAMLAFQARVNVEQEKDKRYPYQINFTQAVSKMKDTIVGYGKKSYFCFA